MLPAPSLAAPAHHNPPPSAAAIAHVRAARNGRHSPARGPPAAAPPHAHTAGSRPIHPHRMAVMDLPPAPHESWADEERPSMGRTVVKLTVTGGRRRTTGLSTTCPSA